MTFEAETPSVMLDAAYADLGFDQGVLLRASAAPDPAQSADWVEKGAWQALAAQVGAEKVFFVNQEPVAVFAQTIDTSPSTLKALYERIWCMARPQLLFLACPGELLVLDLTKAPPKADEAIGADFRLLDVARSVADVQTKLLEYHRERIETGALFEEERFKNSLNRSDRALIRDLKTVRWQLDEVKALDGEKPTAHDLHSLLGRAIFIRYLEDREILTPSYFENIAQRNAGWMQVLEQAPSAPAVEPRLASNYFLRVLQDKEFTYALFDQLAIDFNGDTFPVDSAERRRISQDHLDRLRGFLIGNTTNQEELFFFAYRFDVIPIELISTIYEEFYNEREGKDRNKGSHYTPPALVDFVLRETLTPDILAKKPRVIDPACGSGIFLVESFRRIVRHLQLQQSHKKVTRAQLQTVMHEQIAGIDINEEAVRVAAFSLYLAFLHYQSPREINDQRKLPYLKWVSDEDRKDKAAKNPNALFLDVLLSANAFDLMTDKYSEQVATRFGPGSASVVVGNPPWGYPKKEDREGQLAMQAIDAWCKSSEERPVGDRELSQAFIHLTMALLASGGRAGILVSSGVFFKSHENSRQFRRVWLQSASLKHVANFAHVRHIFFSSSQREAKGVAPFVSVVFEKTSIDLEKDDVHFPYWSAKRTAAVANTRAVVLGRGDMHWLSQRDCLEDEKLWKIYWWGGHRDATLIRRLDAFPRLRDLPTRRSELSISTGRGFQAGTGTPSGWLREYDELPPKKLAKYGKQSLSSLIKVPNEVHRTGQRHVFSGRRLLVARGIKGQGHITSRLETRTFCFRNSIHGVRFDGFQPDEEALVLAVFWSSLARYYYFMSVGSWGFWHDEIQLEHVQSMPIAFSPTQELRLRITGLVEQLQELDLDTEHRDVAPPDLEKVPALENALDEAVFDLYGLSRGDRDLVRELCGIGFDLLYNEEASVSLRPVSLPKRDTGTIAHVHLQDNGLEAYLHTFLEIWNKELEADSEFRWRAVSPPSKAPLLAVSFTPQYKNQRVEELGDQQGREWRELLNRLGDLALVPIERSQIFVDTFFRYVSDREFLFIKRNEQRFWTRTAAREDAESALTYLMNSQSLDAE